MAAQRQIEWLVSSRASSRRRDPAARARPPGGLVGHGLHGGPGAGRGGSGRSCAATAFGSSAAAAESGDAVDRAHVGRGRSAVAAGRRLGRGERLGGGRVRPGDSPAAPGGQLGHVPAGECRRRGVPRRWPPTVPARSSTPVCGTAPTAGLFHDIVDDPSTFEEVTLVAMLAYGALTGAADGWLPATYDEVGRSLLRTAAEHVGPDGLLRPACGSPLFDRPGISAEAQAWFLLAAAAADTDLPVRADDRPVTEHEAASVGRHSIGRTGPAICRHCQLLGAHGRSRERSARWQVGRDGWPVARRPPAAAGCRSATRPRPAIGWRTVVSGGALETAAGLSSKPTTERSCGTTTPNRRALSSRPSAVESQPATIAVGGSSQGQ